MYCRFQAVLVLYSVVSKGLTFDVTDEPCDACECCRSSKCASATRGEEYHPNVCLDGCLPDYWGLNCTSRCPEHCQECDQTLGCVKCIPGFTGPNCSTQCSRSNCFCNTTKECVSCPTGFHLQGGECLSCRRGCRSCSSYFRCDLCQPDLHSDTSNQTLDDGQGNIPALATLGAILGVTAVAIIVLGTYVDGRLPMKGGTNDICEQLADESKS
ncbi:hypothetical protein MAR_032507 [Mya arenaria]|uniref:Uncharacterized protein n=1 Tax=Mya arenaria TaxID=6604 RepID=A0ABY7F6V1_MYAAR|nr:hypothetical protein MAR_032507 [Mya arenaria]